MCGAQAVVHMLDEDGPRMMEMAVPIDGKEQVLHLTFMYRDAREGKM